MNKRTIFDFGMFDASDTHYYLEEGFQVVAVEANKALAESGRRKLKGYLERKQLEIINAAISEDGRPVVLTICGDDLGSSSVVEQNVAERAPLGSYEVRGVSLNEICIQFGVPHYMKVDLEGADRWVVLSITPETKPDYLSFEIGDDFEELFAHAATVGFTRFKLIDQLSFRELANQGNFRDRLARRIVRMLGFAEPKYVRRNGRYFQVGHSSGPVPWSSDGEWSSREQLLAKWERAKTRKRPGVWFDLHAN
jgi:FkbM family methyltransferase